jgi:hypothetical protein
MKKSGRISRPRTILIRIARRVWPVVVAIAVVIGLWRNIQSTFRPPVTLKEAEEALGEYDAANYQTLIARYPLGYVLWQRDHNAFVAPSHVEHLTDLEIDGATMRPPELSKNRVALHLPTIRDRQLGNAVVESVVEIDRVVGRDIRCFGGIGGSSVWASILKDDSKSFICVIGFKRGG